MINAVDRPPSPALPTGTVAFLFSDLEGSTRLAASLGPRFPDLLDRHHAILRRALADAGGIEVGTEGDAFFDVFRSAGDAIRAVGAATALSAGDTVTAARLWGAVAAQRDALGAIATAVDMLGIPDPERHARDALGNAAFEVEVARGRELTLDEAIQLATHDDAGPTGPS